MTLRRACVGPMLAVGQCAPERIRIWRKRKAVILCGFLVWRCVEGMHCCECSEVPDRSPKPDVSKEWRSADQILHLSGVAARKRLPMPPRRVMLRISFAVALRSCC